MFRFLFKKVAIPVITIVCLISFLFSGTPFVHAQESEKTYYILTDHLGNIDVVLDENANVVERGDYLPYGNDRIKFTEDDAPDTDYGFTGKEKDRETGLYYYGARYYEPTIGRFTSIDPLVLDEAQKTKEKFEKILKNPQMLNAYTYALNNPIKFIDLFGESAKNMKGFGRMLDGAWKAATGVILYALPSKKTKALGFGFMYAGYKDIKEGFYTATTEDDYQENIEEKAEGYAIDWVTNKTFKFTQKQINNQLKKTTPLSDMLYYIGEKTEEAGEKTGSFVRENLSNNNADTNHQWERLNFDFYQESARSELQENNTETTNDDEE